MDGDRDNSIDKSNGDCGGSTWAHTDRLINDIFYRLDINLKRPSRLDGDVTNDNNRTVLCFLIARSK